MLKDHYSPHAIGVNIEIIKLPVIINWPGCHLTQGPGKTSRLCSHVLADVAREQARFPHYFPLGAEGEVGR